MLNLSFLIESFVADVGSKTRSSGITAADLYLLIDLFYLPYEHGTSGRALLECFRWLKENSNQLNPTCQLYNDKVRNFILLCMYLCQEFPFPKLFPITLKLLIIIYLLSPGAGLEGESCKLS